MKAKLFKEKENHYTLLMENINDLSGIIASSVFENEYTSGKLSLKNCQSIERGYDLDELAKENAKHYPNNISQEYINSVVSFKDGFQKALELIGDKKYSEEDIRTAILFGQGMNLWKEEEQINTFIQSLQQAEWDVEIEMVPALSNNGNAYYGDIPKLDSDGCLILRRK